MSHGLFKDGFFLQGQKITGSSMPDFALQEGIFGHCGIEERISLETQMNQGWSIKNGFIKKMQRGALQAEQDQ